MFFIARTHKAAKLADGNCSNLKLATGSGEESDFAKLYLDFNM